MWFFQRDDTLDECEDDCEFVLAGEGGAGAKCLGTNTQEDHLILLGEFFAVCQENHTRLKLEKCEFMQETMQYLGSDVG